MCYDENGKYRPCQLYVSPGGQRDALERLNPKMRERLQLIADMADADLGIYCTTCGSHRDPRHNGVSRSNAKLNDPALSGFAADINEIDHVDIGTGSSTNPAAEERVANVQGVIAQFSEILNVYRNLGPIGQSIGTRFPVRIRDKDTQDQHMNHIHVSTNP